MQIYIGDKMTADFLFTIHNRNISTLWETGASKAVISENAYKTHIAQIRFTPAVALDFLPLMAATLAQ